jgi:hypothetical protein
MSRDDNGKLTFTLHDVGVIVSLLVGLAALGGWIGSYYVNSYRIAQLERGQEHLSTRFDAKELRDNKQDEILTVLVTKLDAIHQDIVEIKADKKEKR